jgi:aldehyde dehydrogenase (NAD+)
MTEATKALVVDDALKDGTQIGPVIDQKQLDQDISYIDIARAEGGKLVCGGQRLNRETPGFYLQPALFTETSNDMRINREEVFGPVVSVIRAKGYDEALTIANDTPFGLSSGICTSSLKYSSHFKRNSQAGMVMVNLPTAGVDYHVPFGGRKGSSYGSREQGRYAAEFYTTVKTSYTYPVCRRRSSQPVQLPPQSRTGDDRCAELRGNGWLKLGRRAASATMRSPPTTSTGAGSDATPASGRYGRSASVP